MVLSKRSGRPDLRPTFARDHPARAQCRGGLLFSEGRIEFRRGGVRGRSVTDGNAGVVMSGAP